MIRRPPRSTQSRSSAASDVYKRQVYVNVHTVGYASVTTIAHYKTTNHKKSGKAGKKGDASIGYYISRATPGYRVVVSVRVVSGKRSGSCSTWFIPRR